MYTCIYIYICTYIYIYDLIDGGLPQHCVPNAVGHEGRGARLYAQLIKLYKC